MFLQLRWYIATQVLECSQTATGERVIAAFGEGKLRVLSKKRHDSKGLARHVKTRGGFWQLHFMLALIPGYLTIPTFELSQWDKDSRVHCVARISRLAVRGSRSGKIDSCPFPLSIRTNSNHTHYCRFTLTLYHLKTWLVISSRLSLISNRVNSHSPSRPWISRLLFPSPLEIQFGAPSSQIFTAWHVKYWRDGEQEITVGTPWPSNLDANQFLKVRDLCYPATEYIVWMYRLLSMDYAPASHVW